MAAHVDEPEDIDALLELWRAQLEVLTKQILQIHLHRHVFYETVALVQATPSDDGIFTDVLAQIYANSQAMAIRRLVDNDAQSTSFLGLLGSLRRNHRKFTRDWYVAVRLRDTNDVEFARKDALHTLNSFADEADPATLGRGRIAKSQKQLKSMTKVVQAFADKHVAHLDSSPSAGAPMFEDLNAAIDHVGSLLVDYTLLLEGVGLVGADPVVQGDWQRPLREIGQVPMPWGGTKADGSPRDY